MHCTMISLSLQERCSLVATCTFLVLEYLLFCCSHFSHWWQETLIGRTANSDDLLDAGTMPIQAHGRPILLAILCGFAGVAPRSAMQNLIELLSIVATKFPAETKTWMNDILFPVCVSRFLFLAVDDADTCAGRFCAVESDSRSEAGFCESYHRVCPRSYLCRPACTDYDYERVSITEEYEGSSTTVYACRVGI